jgi:hypothetical protein
MRTGINKSYVFLGVVLFAVLAAMPGFAQKKTMLTMDQRNSLKNAESYLTAVEKELPMYVKFKNVIEKQPEKANLDQVSGALRDSEQVAQKLANAEKAIRSLPQDLPEVRLLSQRLAKARETLTSVQATLTAAKSKKADAVSPDKFPDLAKDLEKMKALRMAYKQHVDFERDAEKVKALWGGLAENRKWADEANTKYQPLRANRVQAAVSLENEYKWFKGAADEFEKKATDFLQKALTQIPAMISKAMSMADKAKAERKPAFFTGGVKQNLEEAERMLASVMVAPNPPPQAKDIRAQLEEAKKKADSLAVELKSEIIASVETPPDVYSGGDKTKLKEMVENEWKRLYPKDEILAIRFHTAEWKRDEGWRWNAGGSAWEKFDRSVLPLKVIVKTSDKIATIYMAFVNRNNLSNSINVGAQTKGGEYVVEEMLLSNLKK